jgi:hypothetical protein
MMRNLLTIPEDESVHDMGDDYDNDDDSSASSGPTSAKAGAITTSPVPWVAILRNDVLLTDVGEEPAPDAVVSTAQQTLDLPAAAGWQALEVPSQLQRQQHPFRGLRLGLRDETAAEGIVWSFCVVYNSDAACARSPRQVVEDFVVSELVRCTGHFRGGDAMWRTGGYHACQFLFAPLLQRKMEEMAATAGSVSATAAEKAKGPPPVLDDTETTLEHSSDEDDDEDGEENWSKDGANMSLLLTSLAMGDEEERGPHTRLNRQQKSSTRSSVQEKEISGKFDVSIQIPDYDYSDLKRNCGHPVVTDKESMLSTMSSPSYMSHGVQFHGIVTTTNCPATAAAISAPLPRATQRRSDPMKMRNVTALPEIAPLERRSRDEVSDQDGLCHNNDDIDAILKSISSSSIADEESYPVLALSEGIVKEEEEMMDNSKDPPSSSQEYFGDLENGIEVQEFEAVDDGADFESTNRPGEMKSDNAPSSSNPVTQASEMLNEETLTDERSGTNCKLLLVKVQNSPEMLTSNQNKALSTGSVGALNDPSLDEMTAMTCGPCDSTVSPVSVIGHEETKRDTPVRVCDLSSSPLLARVAEQMTKTTSNGLALESNEALTAALHVSAALSSVEEESKCSTDATDAALATGDHENDDDWEPVTPPRVSFNVESSSINRNAEASFGTSPSVKQDSQQHAGEKNDCQDDLCFLFRVFQPKPPALI